LIDRLLNLSRFNKQLIMMFIDSIILISILFACFFIRLGHWNWLSDELLLLIIASPVIAIPIFIRFSLYREVIRFIGIKLIYNVTKATTLYALLWGVLVLMSAIDEMPRSVIIMNWLLSLIVLTGLRLSARWLLTNHQNLNITNVLIYGAGSAGRQLSIALMQSKEYFPVAFIDDNKELQGRFINGIKVVSINEIKRVIEKKSVTEVLLTLSSISRVRRNEIITDLKPFKVKIRSLPSVSELAKGKIKVEDLREVSIKDLLGRPSVVANNELLSRNISKKVVMVTGAGGSIGSEICRQILLLNPKLLILFDQSEFALYTIDIELSDLNKTGIKIFPMLGSIRDKVRIQSILNKYSVQTIYHAAAYKHVPLVEYNQSQGILNNVLGTMLLAESAISEKIETFVLISTDKAVRPSSTMGAAKRVAELVLQALSKKQNTTCFTMVRFGNVLDSSGSVIPLFKKQIREGGPITVTHKDIVRYFMTIPEAVELVLQAGSMGNGGDVFVLDMGEPVRIYDLAVKMIMLSGLQVRDKSNLDGDIEIQFVGLRPGEKLFEELLIGDNVSKTANNLIMRAEEKMISWSLLKPMLDKLIDASINDEQEEIRGLLVMLVPEYSPQESIKDFLYKD